MKHANLNLLLLRDPRIPLEQQGLIKNLKTKPFLKWAGGKTQLLETLQKFVPSSYNNYIEAFLGGGALFFFLRPQTAILSDSNPELINCYKVVKANVKDLELLLAKYKNEEQFFYKIRGARVSELNEFERAARFIYLNKTCFNGLYRENKKGEFNVPFGRNQNARICDTERLYEASEALKGATLICSDYKSILRRYVQENDFVFLDPPYHPISGTADFQRYTKDSFYETDHIELREEINRLRKIGAKILSTNSNTPFINELYSDYDKEVIATKRLISSNSQTRKGEDLLIHCAKSKRTITSSKELLENFPGTRYMGSKYKLLPFLWDAIKGFEFSTALDAFSGSGCVSYMLKQKGVEVYSNDFMAFSANLSKALIENSTIQLDEIDKKFLLKKNRKAGSFITSTFDGLYFSREDNVFLDNLRENITLMENPIKKSLAFAAITRACMKKRARGIFTYVGHRYDDGRPDMQLSLKEHFLLNIDIFNSAVFKNGRSNLSFNEDIFDLDKSADLVYLDPPYMTSKSDNDYIRRYHFVEGLVKNWEGLDIDFTTKTKKFKKYPSPFDSKNTVSQALDKLFKKFENSIIVVSYSSNSIPSKTEMMDLLKKYKRSVQLNEIDYRYSFGNQGHKIDNNFNEVKEYLFIAK